MKININFIYSFLLIIIIFFVAIEFHNSNVLESRINSLNKNKVDFNSEKTFKEDYYITQQSHDTNLILVVFTVVITFTGLFTYVNILERYNAKVSEIKDEIKKYKSEYDEQHKRLSKLELDLCFQIANNYTDLADSYKSKNDLKKGIIISMCAMEKYAQVIKLCNADNYKQRILNILHSAIDYDYTLLKDSKTIYELTDLDFSVYKTRVSTISDVLDSQNLQMFNFILSKFKLV